MVPVEKKHYTIRHLSFIICNLWREITSTQHYVSWVQIFDRGNETEQVAVYIRSIATFLKNGSVKPSRSSHGDGSDVQSRNGVF